MDVRSGLWSMKRLWQILSNRSQPPSPDEVGPVLERAKDVILDNLSYFTKIPSVVPQTVDSELVDRLSRLTGLDKSVAICLVELFSGKEFFGTRDEWTSSMDQKHLKDTLLLEIWKFYYAERSYLLHCIHTLVENSSNDRHPYQDLFGGFLKTYDSKHILKEKIIQQLILLSEAVPPTELLQSPVGNLLTSQWWSFNFREQILLLQILIMYVDRFGYDTQDVLLVLQSCTSVSKYPKQHFELENLQRETSYLQCVLLLKMLNLNNRISNPLVTQREVQKNVEKELNRLSNSPEFSPLLLAWMLVHEDPQSTNKFRRFGEEAMRHRVLNVITNMANDSTFTNKSAIEDSVFVVLNDVVSCLLTHFDPERLGSSDLHAAAVALLRNHLVAADFWDKGLENGLGVVWADALVQFPESFVPLLDLAQSLAQAGDRHLTKLTQTLQALPFYSDSTDNVSRELVVTRHSGVELQRPYYPYSHVGHKGFLVPTGATGEIEYKTVRWAAKFSLWEAVIGECKALVCQGNLGASAVQSKTLNRVERSLGLLKLVMKPLLSHYRGLQSAVTDNLLDLINLCCSCSFPLQEVLARSLECLTEAASVVEHSLIAARLTTSRLLPTVQKPLETQGESKLFLTSTGLVGDTITRKENLEGFYPVTRSFVKLATRFAEADVEEIALPCGFYILEEVFPFFMHWNYATVEERDQLLDACLTFARRILDPGLTRSSWQTLFVRVLMDNRRGEADFLLHIATTGYRVIEARMLEQTNWEAAHGPGLFALRQMRLSLSVLNSLLAHKQTLKTDGLSNLETALLSQPATRSAPHFVVVLCEYIHFVFDPHLAILALKILRRCAARWEVSMSACLGSKAQLFRQLWLDVVGSPLDDVQLQESILGLFSEAVAKQPGLIHLLITGDDSERFFENLLKLLDSDSPVLKVASMRLVQSLWTNYCSPAMDHLTQQDGFWKKLLAPLLGEDKAAQRASASCSLRVVAVELCSTGGKLNQTLQKLLQDFIDKDKDHLSRWSDVILDHLPNNPDQSLIDQPRSTVDVTDYELLNSWNDFLVILARYGPPLAATQCTKISEGVIGALVAQIELKKHSRLVVLLSELYLMLLRAWKGSNMAESITDWLTSIGSLLTEVAESEITTLPQRAQAAILTIAVCILRKVPNRSVQSNEKEIAVWLEPAAGCLQSCLQQYSNQLRLSTPSLAVSSITSLSVSLVDQLVSMVTLSSSNQWFAALQENFLLQNVVSAAQVALQLQRGHKVVESILGLLITLSKSKPGSAALLSGNLGISLCLPLAAVGSVPEWTTAFRLYVQLCTVLLKEQGHFFLPEALTLVTVHQERIVSVLLSLQSSLRAKDVGTVLDLMALLGELSRYEQSWRLEYSKAMRVILQAACGSLYFSILYLLRPNWMALVVENRLSAEAIRLRSAQDKLPTETEKETEKLAPEVVEVQNQLLGILSQGLSMLSCFSPHVGTLLSEEGTDIANWDKLLQPSFGTPSFDYIDEVPALSFGTLNAAASHFSRLLTKLDLPNMDRDKVTTVLEQTLTLIVSQAFIYLLDPVLDSQDKQLLKRELGAELDSVIGNLRRQTQRGGKSPASSRASQVRHVTFADQKYFHLIGHIVDRVFK